MGRRSVRIAPSRLSAGFALEGTAALDTLLTRGATNPEATVGFALPAILGVAGLIALLVARDE